MVAVVLLLMVDGHVWLVAMMNAVHALGCHSCWASGRRYALTLAAAVGLSGGSLLVEQLWQEHCAKLTVCAHELSVDLAVLLLATSPLGLLSPSVLAMHHNTCCKRSRAAVCGHHMLAWGVLPQHASWRGWCVQGTCLIAVCRLCARSV